MIKKNLFSHIKEIFLLYIFFKFSIVRHMIYAPSISNSYGSYAFPALADAIYNYRRSDSSEQLIEEIKLQLSIIIYAIQSATLLIKEPFDFTRYN